MIKMLERIKHFILKYFNPIMVGKYRNSDGTILKLTRVSNSTSILNSENLKIGDGVFIGHFNFIDASNGLSIGDGCQITNYISILTHSSHISIRLYGYDFISANANSKKQVGYLRGNVKIGSFTFIGPHTVIMPDTIIGKGCLITAFSYVKGVFPDFSIISGNPAKVIGSTKDLDATYLENNPELYESYNKWAETESN